MKKLQKILTISVLTASMATPLLAGSKSNAENFRRQIESLSDNLEHCRAELVTANTLRNQENTACTESKDLANKQYAALNLRYATAEQAHLTAKDGLHTCNVNYTQLERDFNEKSNELLETSSDLKACVDKRYSLSQEKTQNEKTIEQLEEALKIANNEIFNHLETIKNQAEELKNSEERAALAEAEVGTLQNKLTSQINEAAQEQTEAIKDLNDKKSKDAADFYTQLAIQIQTIAIGKQVDVTSVMPVFFEAGEQAASQMQHKFPGLPMEMPQAIQQLKTNP